MDKGKNPMLLEDEDMFFMHGYQPQFPDGENLLVSNNTSFYDKHEGSGSGLGSDLGLGSVDGTSILDEMEEAEENFFSKFISMNIGLIDSPAFETSSVVPAPSNPMDPSTDPVPQEQAPPETIVSLPAPAGSTDDAPQPIVRRCLSAAALAEIAQHDPKRAKRIITNRLSAVRAKEKKKLYICMLEHKLQCLLSERDALSAKSNINQRDNYCLKAENNRLKESLDNMEQLMRLQDLLNDEMRRENEILNLLKNQVIANGGTMINFIGSSDSNLHAVDVPLATPQFSQLPIQIPNQGQQPQYHPQQQNGQSSYQVQHEQQEQPGQFAQNLQQYQSQIQNNLQVMPDHLQLQQNQQPFVQQMQFEDNNIGAYHSMPSPSTNGRCI